jgi:hypothetical protein
MAAPTFTGPRGMAPSDHFLHLIEQTRPTHEDLMLAGNWLRGEIRERTFRDESYAGGNFIFYSEKYAKQKGQTNVDLYSRKNNKHMLDALNVNVNADNSAIEIGIFGDSEMATRAQLNNEGGTFRTRQGTGKKKLSAKKWGHDIRKQKAGGQAYGTVPARPWLGANDADIAKMKEILIDQIRLRWEQS